jgi:simple sugar transport system permease protein
VTASAAVLFGFFGALGDRLQAFDIPAQFVLMLPYLVAILALTFSRWRIYVRNKPAKL